MDPEQREPLAAPRPAVANGATSRREKSSRAKQVLQGGLASRARDSLLVKLFLPAFLVLVGLVALHTRFMVRMTRDVFFQEIEADLLARAHVLSHEFLEIQAYGDHDRSNLDRAFDRALRLSKTSEEGFHARLLTTRGRVLVGKGPAVADSLLLELTQQGVGEHILRQGRHRGVLIPLDNHAVCQKCHRPRAGPLGWIRLDAPLEGLEASERRIKLTGLTSGLLLSCVFGLTVWALLFIHVRRPLQNLRTAMALVMEGDLSSRYRVGSNDELGRLGRQFNRMVGRLENADRGLREAHVELMMHAERMVNVGEMASRIAHEIRNPLAGIESAVSIFHEDLDESDPDRLILAETLAQIHRIEKTLNDLLSFARPRSPVLEATDLAQLLSGLTTFCRQGHLLGPHRLEFHAERALPRIQLDKDQMSQAFLNVLLNALQVMKEPGRVDVIVSARRDGDHRTWLEVRIRDTGPGIPDEVLPHIFKAFYTTRTKGTGLGLAISRAAVLQHGGDLRVSKTGPDGTEFIFVLPCHRHGVFGDQRATTGVPAASGSAAGGPHREDDSGNARFRAG